MNFLLRNSLLLMAVFGLFFIMSCNNDDDNTNPVAEAVRVIFTNSAASISENGGTQNIELSLSADAPANVTLTISIINGENVEFGDYTTNPAVSGGNVEVTIPAGSSSASFSVTAVDDQTPDGDKSVVFELTGVSGGIELGASNLRYTLTITDDDIPAANSLPITDDFEQCMTDGVFETPSNWTEALVAGSKTDRGWGCSDRAPNTGDWAVRASSFGGEAGTDNAYLILNETINFDASTDEVLNCWVYSDFAGEGELTFVWSADYTGSGDPSNATWNVVTEFSDNLPAQDSEVKTQVTADLSSITGNGIYVAFHFAGGTNASSASYHIDDFSITEGAVETAQITVSVPSLDFGSVSAGQTNDLTYTVSGANLNGDIEVTAPSAFSLSLDGSSFSSSITIPQMDAEAGNVTVTARFAATTGSNGVKTGSIEHTSPGATMQTIEVAGEETGNVSNTVFEENFNASCASGLPSGWEAVSVTSDAEWICTDNTRGASGDAGDYGLEMNGFGADEASEDWLITPEITLASGHSLSLYFDYMARFSDQTGFGLAVKITNSYTGDATTTSWDDLTTDIDNGRDSWDYTSVSPIDLSNYSGAIRIAFFYNCSGVGQGETVRTRLDNVEIK